MVSAEGGATTWLSTTDTPAQATPTAAVLAATHMANNISFFTVRVFRNRLSMRVKRALNHP